MDQILFCQNYLTSNKFIQFCNDIIEDCIDYEEENISIIIYNIKLINVSPEKIDNKEGGYLKQREII